MQRGKIGLKLMLANTEQVLGLLVLSILRCVAIKGFLGHQEIHRGSHGLTWCHTAS